MNLSPNDIRNYEFPNQMRGYDKDEVDSFLDQIATTLENMKQETLKLSMENDALKSQLDNFKKFEDSIKGAAIDARQNADATMSHAKETAEKILSEAKATAEELVSSKIAMVGEYQKQLNRLQQTKESYTTEIKDIINVHLSMINKISDIEFSYTSDETGTEHVPSANDSDSIDVTDSSEVERDKMTTVGSEASNEPTVTEDANAAEAIIPVTEEAPVDPELAAALEGFVHPEVTPEAVTPETMIGKSNIPKLGAIVETTKRAEDIPEGFIVGNAVEESDSSEEDDDTGKFDLAPDVSESTCEHNTITGDEQISPENIVKELDNVVAKFEEELDKVETN